jgi:hypothetical protein
VRCNVEYATADAAVFGPLSSGAIALAAFQSSGSYTVGGTDYALHFRANPGAANDLNYVASLSRVGAATLAYAVVPVTAFTPGNVLFEIGAPIPTAHSIGFDGQPHLFDMLRGYCSVGVSAP